MVDEDVPQYGQFGIDRGHFAKVGLERRAEPFQGSRRVEFADLPVDLFGNEFPLQVCGREGQAVSSRALETAEGWAAVAGGLNTYNVLASPSAFDRAAAPTG